MGRSGTSTLPSRSFPQVQRQPGPSLPQWLPGGFYQPTGLPSQLLQPPVPPRRGLVPGGQHGPIRYFTPNIDKTAPYYIGVNTGWSVASIDGRPITWLHRWFINSGALEAFQPLRFATPDWTSNAEVGGSQALSAIPFGIPPFGLKRLNAQGGYQRQYAVDEQLFALIIPHSPATQRPLAGVWNWRGPGGWPRQRPMPRHIRTQLQQGLQAGPKFDKLTRMQPAASYGQTTSTLVPDTLANLLPNIWRGTNPPTMGGSPYGSTY